MAVFQYKATSEFRDDFMEKGVVIARDRDDAKAKVEHDGFNKVSVKQIRGISALWKGFTADIK